MVLGAYFKRTKGRVVGKMKYIAVVVTYYPSKARIMDMVTSLKKQNIDVIIVDNTPDINLEYFKSISAQVMLNKQNYGIAKAQNIGINRATELGADFICFFDQDSIVPVNFAMELIVNRDSNVCSVYCPLAVDEKTGVELPSHILTKIGLTKKKYSKSSNLDFNVDLVISSGMVVSAKTFKLAGVMDEELFIDLVDFEWCFRCKELDIPIVCVPRVRMLHSIGEGNSSVFLGGAVHSPFRSYFKQRNPYILLTRKHVPFMYSFRLILVTYIQSLIALVSLKEKRSYFKSMLKATIDGMKYIIK